MLITDELKLYTFTSRFGEAKKELLVALPSNYKKNKKYPLIISPHPFGFSHLENYYLGTPDLTYTFEGWKGIPSKFNVIVAIPLGHGRKLDRVSMAWRGQIEDIVDIPKLLEKNNIQINKTYICGLSMGGLETLVAIGYCPEIFSAGFCFNGIADLQEWYKDIKDGFTDKKMREMKVTDVICEEVGGLPEECNSEYFQRSPINMIKNLSKVPLFIYWSSMESIVVNQKTKQTKKLYDQIKSRFQNSEIYEYDHSFDHDFNKFSEFEKLKCHEFCDFSVAVNWLLHY